MTLFAWFAKLFGMEPPAPPAGLTEGPVRAETKQPAAGAVPPPPPPPVAVTPQESDPSVPARLLQPSEGCLELVKHFESFAPTAYPDAASPLGLACTAAGTPLRDYFQLPERDRLSGTPWTVGFGETGAGVNPSTRCTYGEALRMLQARIEAKGEFLAAHLGDLRITQGAFDALVSFYDNVGYGRPGEKDGLFVLKSGTKSTLLRLTEAGDFTGAAEEFAKWTTAKGVELAGLVRRQKAQRAMYLSQDWQKFTR